MNGAWSPARVVGDRRSERSVLNVPALGMATSGWALEQFRDYATASLKLNGMNPTTARPPRCAACCARQCGQLGDEATFQEI
jgi:glucose-6-phosphate 1-dehydrogenase